MLSRRNRHAEGPFSWIRAAAAAGVLLSLASAGFAEAASRSEWTRAEPLASRPVLSGGAGAAWFERGSGLSISLMEAAREVHRVQRFQNPARSTDELSALFLAADAQRAALIREIRSGGADRGLHLVDNVRSGAAGTPLTNVVRCARVQRNTGLAASLAVTKQFLAYTLPDCGPASAGKIFVRDLGTGATTEINALAGALAAAGPYLAWVELPPDATTLDPLHGHDLVVRDVPAGAERYRVPAAEMPSGVTQVSIDASGTAVFTYFATGDSTRLAVGWASPADPHFHPLPLEPRRSYVVQLVNGVLAMRRTSARAMSSGGPESELAVGPLIGPYRTLAAPIGGFDTDGADVVWSMPRCIGSTVVRQPIAGPSLFRTARPKCSLQLGVRPVLEGRVLLAQVRCTGFDSVENCGTSATAFLRGRDGRWHKVGSGPIRTAGGVRISLGRRVAARISAATRVRITVISRDLENRPFARSGTFRIRRAPG